jgi:hypothetical protein
MLYADNSIQARVSANPTWICARRLCRPHGCRFEANQEKKTRQTKRLDAEGVAKEPAHFIERLPHEHIDADLEAKGCRSHIVSMIARVGSNLSDTAHPSRPLELPNVCILLLRRCQSLALSPSISTTPNANRDAVPLQLKSARVSLHEGHAC